MQRIRINTAAPNPPSRSVLIIYTGGTLGMILDKDQEQLVPYDFEYILGNMPELRQFGLELTVISLDEVIDSSNMSPQHWQKIAQVIEEQYEQHDGFVLLHGTDTMAYTASALSYMLDGIHKPVILTGAQLPVGSVRSDAHRNLVTSIEIAAEYYQDRARVPEVCIFFNDVLLRGNRAQKVESAYFDAFVSDSYPVLAKAGITIDYNDRYIQDFEPSTSLKVFKQFEENVLIIKVFPGIQENTLQAMLQVPRLKGVLLETYGSGNAPTASWFLDCLQKCIDQGVVVLNVSQCLGGKVEQGRYETSVAMKAMGVVGAEDMTTEAAITKLMLLLAREDGPERVKKALARPLRGEMSTPFDRENRPS